MKRYDPIAHVSWGEAWGEMEESDDGDYVLHTDAQAEIARLTAEVERLLGMGGRANPPRWEPWQVKGRLA